MRASKFPARKIARCWRFTQSDVDDIFALCANDFRKTETTPVLHTVPMSSGLTATSRKRVGGR